MDLISRQAAIDAAVEAADEWDGGYNRSREEIITMKLRMLPPAQPEPCEDAVSRQAAIDIIEFECGEWSGLAKTIVKAIEQLPSAQLEQTKMIKEIRDWINSGNRGSADYFIVDKIEEIINKYE